MRRFRLPEGTAIFIGISVGAFALDYLLAHSLTLWGAKTYSIWGGEWYRLVTANFLHSGVPHLLFNMYALYVFGSIVEDLAGRAGFFAVALLGGMMGFAASLLAKPEVFSLGASASVFALMGYTIHFRLRRLPLRWISLDGAFLQILALNVLMGLTVSNIDHFAHLGGFVGGFFTAGMLGLPERTIGRTLQETPLPERIFAGACVLAFFWFALSPLTFADAIRGVLPRQASAVESRYGGYFTPFVAADPEVLWLEPSFHDSWWVVEDTLRIDGDGPVAIAVFWRWARGGSQGASSTYKVTWEHRPLPGDPWREVQVDYGRAQNPDPFPDRIFRRSMVAYDDGSRLVGQWRVRVEVDGRLQFHKEFSVRGIMGAV